MDKWTHLDIVANRPLEKQNWYEPKYENEHQVVLLSKIPSVPSRKQESFFPKNLYKNLVFFSQKPRFIPF